MTPTPLSSFLLPLHTDTCSQAHLRYKHTTCHHIGRTISKLVRPLLLGTETGEMAGYRACKCLPNFYRMDRFGACSPCPKKGLICKNDTAMLAPNYYWNWVHKTQEDQYQMFVENIAVEGPSYDAAYTKFNGSLPVAHWCFKDKACLGGVKAECNEGYTGLLCSQCNSGHYSRMNACEKCPTKVKAILQAVGVIIAYILVMVAVIWGDSKPVEHTHGQADRTWADVILSRFKIIISFYQVMMGMFSALTRVKWPASIIVMTRWLRYVEANILELGPLSCIDSRLRFDPLQQFVLAVCLNAGVAFVFFVYLKIRGILIRRKMDLSTIEKRKALSAARKSCYRNIFLFLFTTYPSTCVRIVQITPAACIPLCFSEHETQCSSFLRSDLSVQCFTSRHNTYWTFAMLFLLYPIGFPILVLGLLWKFYHKQPTRQAHADQQRSSENTQSQAGQCVHVSEEPTVPAEQHDHSNSTRALQDFASQCDYGSNGDTVAAGSSSSCSSVVVSTDSTDGPISDDTGSNDEISDGGRNQQTEGGQEQQRDPDITFALSLFYENYKPQYWFWEVTEMYRKLILVTGLSLIGSQSRTQIGIGVLLAGGFSILHAAYQPITDKFENALQTIALLVLFFDVTLGVMLKIADTDIPVDVNTKNDTTGVEVLFMLMNCLVIAIALGKPIKLLLAY